MDNQQESLGYLPVYLFIDWLIDLLIDWLIDLLIDLFIYLLIDLFPSNMTYVLLRDFTLGGYLNPNYQTPAFCRGFEPEEANLIRWIRLTLIWIRSLFKYLTSNFLA